MNDWRDVASHKVNVLAAILTGDFSDSQPAQKRLHSVISGSELHDRLGHHPGFGGMCLARNVQQ